MQSAWHIRHTEPSIPLERWVKVADHTTDEETVIFLKRNTRNTILHIIFHSMRFDWCFFYFHHLVVPSLSAMGWMHRTEELVPPTVQQLNVSISKYSRHSSGRKRALICIFGDFLEIWLKCVLHVYGNITVLYILQSDIFCSCRIVKVKYMKS